MKTFCKISLLATLAACTSPNKPVSENGGPSPASAAEIALMSKHDSLMAQTDQLMSLKGKLSGYHTEAAAPYIHGLQAADAAMMGWMHQYKAPDSTATAEARLAYFQQQQEKLKAVQGRFRSSLDSANRFMKQYPPAGEVAPTSSK
ncbi:hypothetical protein ACFST9_00840 [Hymenobacter monticola]|uniref:Transposase n=1 Tax=Hymenobacter monticola TaxID=1705399 RepID=A0ABY4BA22_9BACT|nr:hypothetical protein [Hymenobacter monticola]UOE33490.1 hypothetical protein MTP16_20490 [Hymenobacter monticola]